MEFDDFHSAGTEHQAADSLSGLCTTREDYMAIDDALPVLSVVSTPKEEGKVGVETIQFIYDYSDNEFNLVFQTFPAAVVAFEQEMNSTLPHAG